MKKLFPLILFVGAIFLIAAQPPVLRQFGTTNTPTALTNIIQSLAGSDVTSAGDNNFTGSNHFAVLSSQEIITTGDGPGFIAVENDSTNIITLNGTNGAVTATSFVGSLVFSGASTFPSATNTFTLANDCASITTATDIEITNILGQIAGQFRWGTLWVSNSAATAITARWTTAGRKIGSSTTNALSIAAGKFGMFSVECLGTSWTNYATAAEQ